MALLKIERGVGSGTSYTIDQSASLGRDPEKVDILIMDQKASRTHALIFKKDNTFYIKDLDSRNGTMVNGKRVKGTIALEPGDHIRIGLTWLSFGEELDIERIARELQEYRMVEAIGEDEGIGLYFKVQQLKLDRYVALKLLPPNIIKAHPHLKRKFRDQARALAKLDHENISIILDFGAKKSYLYFTTEYIEGQSLHGLLAKGPLPKLQALEIALGVARGLAYAHGKKIIHQDVKPVNIIISGSRIILYGFGIAAMLAEVTGDELSKAGIVGTSEYLSPEQVQNKPLDYRTDIYSLGVVMYEMFCGQVPFQGSSPYEVHSQHISHIATPIAELAPHIPIEIAQIIHKCLEKDPERRPSSCTEIAEVLENALTRLKLINLLACHKKKQRSLYYLTLRLIEREWILWVLAAIFAVTNLVLIKLLLG